MQAYPVPTDAEFSRRRAQAHAESFASFGAWIERYRKFLALASAGDILAAEACVVAERALRRSR
jgi:hypothetical protein